MTRTRGLLFFSLLAFHLLAATAAVAQKPPAPQPDETVAEVPVLTQFHEVIYKLWHNAWPEKNLTMLADLLPEIREYSDTLARAELPGILRDKQKVWNENIARLQTIVREYAAATVPLDSQKLLDAAEQLHAQYEALVRVTRPVLKEVEEFHQVLYMIYHHYLPAKDQPKLASSVDQLKKKMVLLKNAVLPERLKAQEKAFIAARAKLAKSVGALDAATAKKDLKSFTKQVETVHADYLALQSAFE
jgi:hypothetical protein